LFEKGKKKTPGAYPQGLKELKNEEKVSSFFRNLINAYLSRKVKKFDQKINYIHCLRELSGLGK